MLRRGPSHPIAVFSRRLSREMSHRKSHRKGRKSHRKGHKGRRSARRQHGGGFSFTGPAFDPAKGLAPVESRTFYDDCANQIGGGCNGGCPGSYPPMQRGGGGGTGGYTIDVTSNALGKVHDGYIVAPCPQRGGGGEIVSSYPAGFGFGPKGAVETPSGSAHYLDPLPYGQQCMGGGARSRRHRSASRKGSRSAHRRHRKGRR